MFVFAAAAAVHDISKKQYLSQRHLKADRPMISMFGWVSSLVWNSSHDVRECLSVHFDVIHDRDLLQTSAVFSLFLVPSWQCYCSLPEKRCINQSNKNTLSPQNLSHPRCLAFAGKLPRSHYTSNFSGYYFYMVLQSPGVLMIIHETELLPKDVLRFTSDPPHLFDSIYWNKDISNFHIRYFRFGLSQHSSPSRTPQDIYVKLLCKEILPHLTTWQTFQSSNPNYVNAMWDRKPQSVLVQLVTWGTRLWFPVFSFPQATVWYHINRNVHWCLVVPHLIHHKYVNHWWHCWGFDIYDS